MNVEEKYVVYETNSILESNRHLSIEKVNFDGWQSNSFDSEREAIEALVKDGKTYCDYLIIKKILITT